MRIGRTFHRGRAGAVRVFLAGLACLAASAGAADLRLPCVKDVWVSAYNKEKTNSMGKTPRLKIKSLEEFALLDFDLAALKGKRVAPAGGWLYLHADGDQAAASFKQLKLDSLREKLKGIPFRFVGVSTVSSPWAEGLQAEEYKDDAEGKGACFLEASRGADPWAWPGSKLWDVIQGNGNSVGSRVECERLAGFWFRVPVSRAILENLLAGGGFGLCLSEDTYPQGKYALDGYFHSRESAGLEPYLTVQVEGEGAAPPPGSAPDAQCAPAPDESTTTSGAVRITLTVPPNAAAYHIYAENARLEPWQVARPAAPGTSQTLVIRDLPADRELAFRIAVADAYGNLSAETEVRARTAPAKALPPKLPERAFQPKGAEPAAHDGKLKVWAVPEGTLSDPLASTVHFEGAAGNSFRAANPVWDGAADLIRLAAARGEFASFELLFERAGEEGVKNIQVQLGDLAGPGGAVYPAAAQARLFRTWYVKPKQEWLGEYAIPHTGALAVPWEPNGIAGQKHQGLLVDLHIPKETAPGAYEGTIQISAEGVQPFALKLRLEVFAALIPDELAFLPELNFYGSPGAPGSAYFQDAYKLAHYHRCTVNALPYSQGGNIRPDWAVPQADGVWDWKNFDAKFGPLLDGSLFKDNPRSGVPVAVFYLGFFEFWPCDYTKDFGWNKRGKDAATVSEYRLLGPRVDQALGAQYRKGFADAAAEFVKHFEARGWTHTEAQFYLNNKWDASGQIYWHLDEPGTQPDYEALAAWGRVWKEGVQGQRSAHLKFRGDISRPMWMFETLDGLLDTVYVNSGAFGYARTLAEMARRNPCAWRVYGSCNDPGTSNLQSAAWCLKAYAAGADGVLPWKANGKGDFEKGGTNALLVDGQPAGHSGPVASLRVLALRQGAHLAELLQLLARKKSWTREQAGCLVSQRVPLGSRFQQKFEDDAAAVEFEGLTASGFAELKEGLLRLLAEP